MNAYDTFTSRELDYFTTQLPLVRALRVRSLLGAHYQITAIYADEIVHGRCKYLENIHPDHSQPLDANTLAKRLRRVRRLPLDSQTSCRFNPGNRRARKSRFQLRGHKSLNFAVPTHEIEPYLAFLREKLGEGLRIQSRPRMNGFWLALLGLLILGLMTFFLLQPDGGIYFAIPFGMLGLTILGVVVYDQFAEVPPWLLPSKRRRVGKDLSGREPFRSRWLGLSLKVICGSFLLLSLIASLIGIPGGGLLLHLIALLGLYAGHLLSQHKPKYVQAKDTRDPILYLRSFLDDRKQSLVVTSGWANVAGIRPASMLLSPWNYIFLLHPARILRIMFNWSADTTEEQIGLFMRGLGPFVAIGQPGEKFASPGASRMYVSNEEWQNVVDSYLSDSQIVVLQPASTEGIWWEVERVLSSVPLERVLFCLVNFHLHQSEYEAFRRRIEPSLKKSLPTLGGLTTTPAFLFFDSDAMPHIAPTSYREPILWPVLGNAVDLATTLKPFLAGSVPASAIAHASPPKGVSERSHFAASCVYFFAIMIVLLIPFASTARNAALRAKADQVALSADSATPGDAGSKVDPSASDAPESAMTTLIRQADLHLDRKEWPAMDRVTREMLDLDSNLSTAHVYRGLYFKEVNQLPDAIRELEEATRLSPNEATLWNILGQLQLSSQLLEFAEVSFTKALEFSPDTPNFHVNRGLVRLNQEKFTPAAEDFAKALEFKFSDPGRACDLCGQAWLKAGKVMEALPYFNSAVQIVPDNADYQLHRADAFFSLGNQQFADGNASTFARGGYEEVLRLVPDFGPALFGRGMVLQRLQEHAAAIADFDKLLVREPNNDLILWRRGYSHLEAGQYERAFADFARASELDPKDQSAPELLIRIRVAQGKFDEALELCLRQLKADPTSQMLQFYNAIIRSSINPEDDEVDELRSRVSLEFLKSGDLSKVISGAMLEMVSKLTPERSQAAIEKLERQASTHPEVPLVRILQVALHIQSGELADARTQLDTIETSKLNEMAAAVLGLTKAKLMAKEIVADTTAKKTLELSDEMKAAMAWFEKQCPMHFEEGKPETLKDDWAIRVVLAKFYRDVKMLLNTIAK